MVSWLFREREPRGRTPVTLHDELTMKSCVALSATCFLVTVLACGLRAQSLGSQAKGGASPTPADPAAAKSSSRAAKASPSPTLPGALPGSGSARASRARSAPPPLWSKGLSRKRTAPPPLRFSRSRRSGRSARSSATAQETVPGTDTAGRIDQAGKGVSFYPSVRGSGNSAKNQTSPTRPFHKREKAATTPRYPY
jgi:hypothetical protein